MPRRVLVVDDDPTVREIVAAVLEASEIEVHEADTGAAAVRAVDDLEPDLVVLDITMPDMDGWDALDRIRSTSDVPVLMLTALVEEEDKVRALRKGADDYVAKPLSPAEFSARVEALLRRAMRTRPPVSEVGSYRLEAELGRGGMGVVYRARHASMDRVVALKVLPAELTPDKVARERFIREWKTAASLQHPNIVPIYDAGEIDGRLFIAMRFIDGADLASAIDEARQFSLDRTVAVIAQIGPALDAAHAQGVVHRDVKPGNILLEGERAWLTDFGLAKIAEPSRVISKPGQAIGTPEYLAPEQVRGLPITGATDVYALGCVAFEMLTGRSPFAHVVPSIALLYAHMSAAPPAVSDVRAGLPAAVDEVIAKALAKEPAERYETAAAFAAALDGAR